LRKYPAIAITILLIFTAIFGGCIRKDDGEGTYKNDWTPEYGVNYTVNVIHVVDGDTFDAVFPAGTEERIRLLGIDTPETTANSNNEHEYGNITDLDCLASYGLEAKTFAESWLDGKALSIQFDESAGFKGYYGRWLAYAYLPNGTDFNAELIEQGYARAYDEATFAKDSYYIESQNQAMDEEIGLWGCVE